MLTLCLAGLVFFFFGGGEMSMVYWKVWLSPRSVPAWAGEPTMRRSGRQQQGVYPRVGGGTFTGSPSWHWPPGLSPRGRGNLVWGVPVYGYAHRSIPAWAGEPTTLREERIGSSKGSIPAWAGEPLQAARS